jgi:hypothetical protein
MIIKSLSELQEADERTLRFGPLGLGGRMHPEDSAQFWQQVMARHELVPAVAESTQQSFGQLREIFAYGVLCYDIFTVINDHALLVFEQALRDRFTDHHKGTVTFVEPRTGKTENVAADRYEQVYDFVSRHRGWKLQVACCFGLTGSADILWLIFIRPLATDISHRGTRSAAREKPAQSRNRLVARLLIGVYW